MIFLAVFVVTQVAAILTNSSSINEGFCDQDVVNLSLKTDCDFSCIEGSIHNNKTNFSNLILQCDNETCFTQWNYDLTHQTLNVSFPFQPRNHGGKFINFRTTCYNHTHILDSAFLKPCLSGFTGNGTVVGSNVKLYCEHTLFKASTSGIRITYKGNAIAHCINQTCIAGTGLPNGVSIEVTYRTGMMFLCRMDGAIFNLTEKIIELISQTQNTFSTTQMFSHDTSSPTSQSSPTISTSLVTGEEDNSAEHVARDSLMTFSIYILHLIPYITT
uniref:Uncharacterized protein LOC111117496 isoform X5 n=1 Tax=Crassostrea virginica TaxID=6565 RepID=A0A8B8C9B8_CRAVI|nr:uncharacterized protein LOC111117496 isoform X5 [Crassostrea virginica]